MGVIWDIFRPCNGWTFFGSRHGPIVNTTGASLALLLLDLGSWVVTSFQGLRMAKGFAPPGSRALKGDKENSRGEKGHSRPKRGPPESPVPTESQEERQGGRAVLRVSHCSMLPNASRVPPAAPNIRLLQYAAICSCFCFGCWSRIILGTHKTIPAGGVWKDETISMLTILGGTRNFSWLSSLNKVPPLVRRFP